MSLKIAVVVGHNKDAPGAGPGPGNYKSEYTFNRQVAAQMKEWNAGYGLEIEVFERKAGLSYSREIDEVYGRVDAWKARASIELHFNAATPAATGTETLCSSSRNSQNLAQVVQAAMLEHLDLRDRGVKPKKATDRGGRSLYAGRAPAILVEPFFCSNADDRRAATKLGVEGFARMYLGGLAKYVPR